MKKVMLLGLMLCLSLALAAPALAEASGGDKVITHPDQKGSRPTVPLVAHKFLTMRLKARNFEQHLQHETGAHGQRCV